MILILILVFIAKSSNAVIYRLNESEYNRMPPLYGLDNYEQCLLEAGGTYCVVDVVLHGPGSHLMHMIQGYSEHTLKHYNHTQIHRGVCVTRTCTNFLQHNITNEDVSLKVTLEACLNDSLWNNYEIQGKLADIRYCKKEGETVNLDNADKVVAVIYVLIILLNIVGSLYDQHCKDGEKTGNPYLLAFSIKRNWSKLLAPNKQGLDPRAERLKAFHGLRAIVMVCVFFSHTALIMGYSYVENPLYIETAYDDLSKQILYNGTLVTSTYFMMSSFLLAYNMELQAEKHKIKWIHLLKGILLRWLRLTPVYALALATICTWMRHLGSGPLWELMVTSEAEACREYWWAHVLYINNYVYGDAYCLPQTWYLAADTQLFCVGLLVLILVRGSRARKVVLLILFIISILILAAHTYFQDLNAVVLQTPESCRTVYDHNDTFRLLFIRGHTNLSSSILGLAGGLLTYHWQKNNKDFSHFKKFKWMVWLIFPAILAVILSGGLFYVDGAPPSTALRVTYAALYKPVFQILIIIVIISFIFKIESLYRGIVEWSGFKWLSRVSYSGFFLHTMFQRAYAGTLHQPMHLTDYWLMMFLAATILVSFLSAGALWLTVEEPATAVVRALLAPAPATPAPASDAKAGTTKV